MSQLVGTPAQVAEALETSEESVRWLKDHHGLPHVYVNKQSWVVPWKALDDWLATEVGRNALRSLEAAS